MNLCLFFVIPDQIEGAADADQQETVCHMKVIDHVDYRDDFSLKEKVNDAQQHKQAGQDPEDPYEILQVLHRDLSLVNDTKVWLS